MSEHWFAAFREVLILLFTCRNHRYVAHKTPHLTWDCTLTVQSREIWAKWRKTVLGESFCYVIVRSLIVSLRFGGYFC